MRSLSSLEMYAIESGAAVPDWVKCVAASAGVAVTMAGVIVTVPVSGFVVGFLSYSGYLLAVDTLMSWC